MVLDRLLADLPALVLALTALLLAGAGIVLVFAAVGSPGEDGFSWRWQVGGFGQPARGWRFSSALAHLLAGLLLAALAVGLAMSPRLQGATANAAAPPASGASR